MEARHRRDLSLIAVMLFFLFLLTHITACSPVAHTYQNSITTAPAAPSQCPTGGSVVTINDQPILVCNGPIGNTGGNGHDGHDAPPTIISSQPATLLQCPTGGSVLTVGTISTVICNGLNGAPGVVGPAGPSGSPGAPGSPGTSFSFVTLCPGVTSYPGVFVEIAMCVGGNLYGVYSANGGFLTYFPPGNYSSNGIGASCNLTIQPNCVVSH